MTSRLRKRAATYGRRSFSCYYLIMKTHKGSCHCGAVTYEATGDFTTGYKCNCSHCQRKGFLLAFIPASDFKLLSGEDNLNTYLFNKKHINHQFCQTCGVESFALGDVGDGNVTAAVNLNCLEDFDLEAVTVERFDGRNS